MSDTETTLKHMVIGGVEHAIIEPAPLPVQFADVYTELRIIDGVLHLSLGTAVVDYGTGGVPQIRVVARLRLPMGTVANIQAGIEQIQSQLAKAKESAN
ncbi:MAG: hypothetical protein ACTHN2_21225 [Nitrobacter sp.]|jgi:hypothetical protein